MATESSIMDSNSFKEEYTSMLSPQTKEMIDRREQYLGGAYRLFYRKPVNLVRGFARHNVVHSFNGSEH